jgi:hypothetical protein
MLADLRATFRGYCLRLVLVALAGVVTIIGLSLLALGAVLGLAEIMVAPWAAALTGAAALVLAGLAMFATRWVGGRSTPKPARTPTPAPSGAAPGEISSLVGLFDTLEEAIAADARSQHPRFAVLALAAGCALGASPRLRRMLADLVR